MVEDGAKYAPHNAWEISPSCSILLHNVRSMSHSPQACLVHTYMDAKCGATGKILPNSLEWRGHCRHLPFCNLQRASPGKYELQDLSDLFSRFEFGATYKWATFDWLLESFFLRFIFLLLFLDSLSYSLHRGVERLVRYS